jgi:dCMP deaminase
MRPSREKILVENAFDWAQRSTCDRLHVGALVHRDGRILVTGYNGAPAGLPHCDFEHTTEDCLAVHAEQNCIAYAARWGIVLDGAEMVVTHQPCLPCARSIVNAGIQHVTYVHPYRLVDGLSLLLDAGIVVEQYLDGDGLEKIGLPSD